MCLALREGLLRHGPGDGVAILRDLVTHTLHGDVRRVAGQLPHANDDKCELKIRDVFQNDARHDDENRVLTAMPMTGDAWLSFIRLTTKAECGGGI